MFLNKSAATSYIILDVYNLYLFFHFLVTVFVNMLAIIIVWDVCHFYCILCHLLSYN